MIFIVGGASSGKTAYAATHYNTGYKVIDNYKDWIKNQMEQGRNPIAEAEALVSHVDAADKLVIIGTEMGLGVVPMEEKERKYREMNGRVNCLLAAHADTVIRMICGVPQTIKQE